ncbi:MAG: hypothetical protein AAFQ82_07145 [Myxococcota bacterium]
MSDPDHVGLAHYAESEPPPPLAKRNPRVLCMHRVRDGAQWQPRRRVSELARGPWSPFCDVVDREESREEFLGRMRQAAFVLCVEGGGLDPSPKAWEALLQGAVPIIRRSPLHRAYGQLPVLEVAQWEPQSLTQEMLVQAQVRFSALMDGAGARKELLHRLSLDYWWQQILEALRPARISSEIRERLS